MDVVVVRCTERHEFWQPLFAIADGVADEPYVACNDGMRVDGGHVAVVLDIMLGRNQTFTKFLHSLIERDSE